VPAVPAELMISANAAMTASTVPITVVRTFTCPPYEVDLPPNLDA
jgi:hypothetical protein